MATVFVTKTVAMHLYPLVLYKDFVYRFCDSSATHRTYFVDSLLIERIIQPRPQSSQFMARLIFNLLFKTRIHAVANVQRFVN